MSRRAGRRCFDLRQSQTSVLRSVRNSGPSRFYPGTRGRSTPADRFNSTDAVKTNDDPVRHGRPVADRPPSRRLRRKESPTRPYRGRKAIDLTVGLSVIELSVETTDRRENAFVPILERWMPTEGVPGKRHPAQFVGTGLTQPKQKACSAILLSNHDLPVGISP